MNSSFWEYGDSAQPDISGKSDKFMRIYIKGHICTVWYDTHNILNWSHYNVPLYSHLHFVIQFPPHLVFQIQVISAKLRDYQWPALIKFLSKESRTEIAASSPYLQIDNRIYSKILEASSSRCQGSQTGGLGGISKKILKIPLFFFAYENLLAP